MGWSIWWANLWDKVSVDFADPLDPTPEEREVWYRAVCAALVAEATGLPVRYRAPDPQPAPVDWLAINRECSV